jgi:hypothetical protein
VLIPQIQLWLFRDLHWLVPYINTACIPTHQHQPHYYTHPQLKHIIVCSISQSDMTCSVSCVLNTPNNALYHLTVHCPIWLHVPQKHMLSLTLLSTRNYTLEKLCTTFFSCVYTYIWIWIPLILHMLWRNNGDMSDSSTRSLPLHMMNVNGKLHGPWEKKPQSRLIRKLGRLESQTGCFGKGNNSYPCHKLKHISLVAQQICLFTIPNVLSQ